MNQRAVPQMADSGVLKVPIEVLFDRNEKLGQDSGSRHGRCQSVAAYRSATERPATDLKAIFRIIDALAERHSKGRGTKGTRRESLESRHDDDEGGRRLPGDLKRAAAALQGAPRLFDQVRGALRVDEMIT
ncbi:MAG: hypothetical protein ABI782_04220, partial [Anaerolineaceae bacterium]